MTDSPTISALRNGVRVWSDDDQATIERVELLLNVYAKYYLDAAGPMGVTVTEIDGVRYYSQGLQ